MVPTREHRTKFFLLFSGCSSLWSVLARPCYSKYDGSNAQHPVSIPFARELIRPFAFLNPSPPPVLHLDPLVLMGRQKRFIPPPAFFLSSPPTVKLFSLLSNARSLFLAPGRHLRRLGSRSPSPLQFAAPDLPTLCAIPVLCFSGAEFVVKCNDQEVPFYVPCSYHALFSFPSPFSFHAARVVEVTDRSFFFYDRAVVCFMRRAECCCKEGSLCFYTCRSSSRSRRPPPTRSHLKSPYHARFRRNASGARYESVPARLLLPSGRPPGVCRRLIRPRNRDSYLFPFLTFVSLRECVPLRICWLFSFCFPTLSESDSPKPPIPKLSPLGIRQFFSTQSSKPMRMSPFLFPGTSNRVFPHMRETRDHLPLRYRLVPQTSGCRKVFTSVPPFRHLLRTCTVTVF